MKVYLINPKFPITYWGFEYVHDLTGIQYTSPPLGLATVAALTPDDIEVELCDENIEEINFDTDADLIGLTAYLVQEARAFQIAAEFRRRGKMVVLGGPITSLDPAGCKGKVDILFRGEGEYIWPQFLADLQAGSHHAEYVQTEPVDMRDSPIPRFDLLKLEHYHKTSIQTTRGCPFNCEFCDIVVLFGRKVRCKSVAQVISEVREAAKYHVKSIFFTDDNFVGNLRYVKRLLRAIIEFHQTEHTTADYMAQASMNLARDEELLQLLYEAHVTKVFVGIESPRKESLKETNKGQNLHGDLVADVKKIQSYNISVVAGMIVGFDHDDPHIFQEHLDFMMASHVTWVMTGLLQAFPNTPLYERMAREQRLDSASVTDGNNTSINSNIIPKSMTKDELISGYVWLLKQLYSYENYAKRALDTLKDYARRPYPSRSLPTIAELKIVLRTLRYYFLTLDRQRRKFSWTILKYVLLHKPSTFYAAMSQLVGFKHFHLYVHEHLEKAHNVQTHLAGKFSDAVNSNTVALSRQAAAVYAELKKQAETVRRQAAVAREEFQRETAAVSQYASERYDNMSQQTAAFIAQATGAYDALGKQVTAVSRHAVTAYTELAQQAALLSQHVSTLNQRIAARYAELSQQAATISQQAALLAETLEQQGGLRSSGAGDDA